MARKLTPFFATQHDISMIAQDVANIRPIEFVLAGLFEEPTLAALRSLESLEPFNTYLISDRGAHIEVRAISQRGGSQMFAVDQLNNPHSVALRCGGMLNHQHLVASQIGTVGDSKQSEETYALFAKAIRKRFTKLKSYYVGPQALVMLDDGARLSPTTKSPREFDLVR